MAWLEVFPHNFFLPPYATTKDQTHTSRVAPPWGTLIQDPFPNGLPWPGRLIMTYISWVQFRGFSIRYPTDSKWSILSGTIPGYGDDPRVTSSHRRIPKLQTSLLLVYKWSRRLSGAIHLTGTGKVWREFLETIILSSSGYGQGVSLTGNVSIFYGCHSSSNRFNPIQHQLSH